MAKAMQEVIIKVKVEISFIDCIKMLLIVGERIKHPKITIDEIIAKKRFTQRAK